MAPRDNGVMSNVPPDMVVIAVATRRAILEKLALAVGAGPVIMRGPEVLLDGHPVAMVEMRLHPVADVTDGRWAATMEVHVVTPGRDLPTAWVTSWPGDARNPGSWHDHVIAEIGCTVVVAALWNWEAAEREVREHPLVTVELDGTTLAPKLLTPATKRMLSLAANQMGVRNVVTTGTQEIPVEDHPAAIFRAAGCQIKSCRGYFAVHCGDEPVAAAKDLSAYPTWIVMPWSGGGSVDFSEPNAVQVWGADMLTVLLREHGWISTTE